ncbi:MAG TPA: isoprenylcysteine carboxylmethyltransferase family protein [Candidatus Angelobacter sp.]|nr:isoprenylcysteine carboxylmethyltransferase family protein [Candidatus Angelobacter sp.]
MSTAFSAIKTAIFTLCVPLVVAVWIPQRMLAGSPGGSASSIATHLVGGLLFVLGVIGYFWCAALFVRAQGTPAPIFPTAHAVVSGPYRMNRNPMYTSVLAVVFGQALFYWRRDVALYGLLLAVCFHLFILLYEEPALRAQFGEEYEDFCHRVPRWIPLMHLNYRRR